MKGKWLNEDSSDLSSDEKYHLYSSRRKIWVNIMKLNVNENSFCCFSKNKYKRVRLKNCLQSTTDVIGAKHQEDQMKLVFLYYDFF